MKKTIIIASLITLFLIMSSTKVFAKITKDNIYRGEDPLGDGAFGASRSNGTRKHKGIDIVTKPGETIFSPITGKVTRFPIPYADDNRYNGAEITNSTYRIMIFYMKANVSIGSTIIAGQSIGIAQNISAKHGAAMKNHVHYEVYKNGILIDPTNMFK